MYYVVICVKTARVVYEGDSDELAAEALEPGTVYSRAEQLQDAHQQAHERWYAAWSKDDPVSQLLPTRTKLCEPPS